MSLFNAFVELWICIMRHAMLIFSGITVISMWPRSKDNVPAVIKTSLPDFTEDIVSRVFLNRKMDYLIFSLCYCLHLRVLSNISRDTRFPAAGCTKTMYHNALFQVFRSTVNLYDETCHANLWRVCQIIWMVWMIHVKNLEGQCSSRDKKFSPWLHIRHCFLFFSSSWN